MQIGRKIYFDIQTGNVLVDTGERQGCVIETTFEHDIEVYSALSERNKNTFDVIQLEYGQYAQDFSECNGYRINVENKSLEFSYPDPNNPEVEQPYQAPLSEQVNEFKLQLMSADEKYKLIDKNTLPLTDLKEAKIAQLKEYCSNAIYEGFTSTILRNEQYIEFGFNTNDQNNFTQTLLLVVADSQNTTTSIEWKSKNLGVVTLTKDEFLQVTNDAKQHKLTQQYKYWDLENQVLSALDNTTVDSIVW